MDDKHHLEITLELWKTIIKELEAMKDFLTDEKINNQFYRRLFIRNVFSIIETYLYMIRELIINKSVIDKNTPQLEWYDLAILQGKKVVLNAKGEASLKDDFQNFEPSLRFTLNTFSKAFESALPNYSDINFEKLKKLYKRRNEITHPKSYTSLIISDVEIKDTVLMLSWFLREHSILNDKFLKWVQLNEIATI